MGNVVEKETCVQGEKNLQVAIHWFPASFPPASSFTASRVPKCTAWAGPAPKMTDDTPRHSARKPSVDDILVKAFPTPLYTANGVVAKTCIRVWVTFLSIKHNNVLSAYLDAVDWKHNSMLRDPSLFIFSFNWQLSVWRTSSLQVLQLAC